MTAVALVVAFDAQQLAPLPIHSGEEAVVSRALRIAVKGAVGVVLADEVAGEDEFDAGEGLWVGPSEFEPLAEGLGGIGAPEVRRGMGAGDAGEYIGGREAGL